MDQQLQAAFDYIDRHEEAMLGLWQSIVSIESPSANAEGVARIASHLDTYCDALGMERELHRFGTAGPALTAWTKPGPLPPVAILGHLDTVHPVGSFGPEPFRREGDKVYGPGVYDMKGGVVIGLFAIRALKAAGFHDRQLRLLLVGDEEVAHAYSDGESGRLVEEAAQGCAAVFNCESGQPNGEVTVARKGGAIFNIRIYGKAAHAGKEPWKGVSAIRQAAEMIVRIEDRTDWNEVTYNCGRISGGKGANVVPDYCEFSVGIRYYTNSQYEAAAAFLEALCREPMIQGVRCEMEQRGFYPAMEPVEKTNALLEVYREGCRLLGQPLPEGLSTGGCSDSAFVTRIGVPALCSLGAAGGGAHALEEYALASSLTVQCKKLAAAILLLPPEF